MGHFRDNVRGSFSRSVFFYFLDSVDAFSAAANYQYFSAGQIVPFPIVKLNIRGGYLAVTSKYRHLFTLCGPYMYRSCASGHTEL